ncbi:MAG: tryptophan 2,3-dioxygenase [Bernardetiaceae bacterium]|nr:tryptophan 2,3-dioxygenase [Bernardetiaceae bacterium]
MNKELKTLVESICNKYENLGENPMHYLKGLLEAKPINYWDYVEIDTLLSLQKPRTDYKDEEIFIIYHQITELYLKLILHEVKQIVAEEEPTNSLILDKTRRINRYTEMLINSFDIMKVGMSHEDYNKFRMTLTPASGFQSAQFRYIELYCTELPNLINEKGKTRISTTPTTEEYFEHIYWKDAGLNRQTGKKTLTLSQFEARYLDSFIAVAEQVKGKTFERKILSMPLSEELKALLRQFDYLYNIAWPMTHLSTARHYLESKDSVIAATGGSEWKKYLHPKFQQRKFFPSLWTEAERESWAKEYEL